MFDYEAKILVADDSAVTRKTILQILSDLGFSNVTAVADGDTAWQKISHDADLKKPFQVIICDWEMPHVNGLEVLKKVRNYPKTKETPFILLTGNSEKDLILKAAQAGVTAYISKPFSASFIEEKLKAIPQIQLKKAV